MDQVVYSYPSDKYEVLIKFLEDLADSSRVFPQSEISAKYCSGGCGEVRLLYKDYYLTLELNKYDRYRLCANLIEKVVKTQNSYELYMLPLEDTEITHIKLGL